MAPLPVAVRAWVRPTSERRSSKSPRASVEVPKYALVFDVETTIDQPQALTFGSYRRYRIVVSGTLVRLVQIEEGIFHADDLAERDPEGLRALERYVEERPGIRLMQAVTFVRAVLHPKCYKRKELLVGFNLPFDLSRLASGWGESRAPFEGGISLVLQTYEGPAGPRENRWRPRIGIKTIDSKRHLMGFTRPISPGRKDLGGFRGHFLDVRGFAFAWTDRSHSLASLCEALGVEHPKTEAASHGDITDKYIDYNRRDVQATGECFEKLLGEHLRHPIELQPTKAFSPASGGKAYLRSMGILPVLDRQPDFSEEVLAAAMCAYYGGRAECRIRDVDLPVVYLDFVSMYPTVNALMGLWDLVIAEGIDAVEDTDAVQAFLEEVTLGSVFDPETWTRLPVLAQIRPDDDVLPVRALYEPGGTWNIGVNPLRSSEPMWYTLADLVASRLLIRRSPKVLRAIRLIPVGQQDGLRAVHLRGEVKVDPRSDDFFTAVIEERKRLPGKDLRGEDRERLDRALKVLANSTSYGINAEIVRHELAPTKPEIVQVYRADGSTFEDQVGALEEPGEYSFPPLAACTSGAARLMLAMLERCVSDSGGSFVFCDTDSMAIVASRRGGLLPCPGGAERSSQGRQAVRALSWDEVEAIRGRFATLNPYERATVPGSILEFEDENVDSVTGRLRQLWCRSISAKRYTMFNKRQHGNVLVRKCSEHGLGHLLNPTDPSDEDRDWIDHVWEGIVGFVDPSGEPAWLDRPAVSRITASTPALLRPFASYNEGRPYRDQIKPFNFLISVQAAPFGLPEGVDPARFHLIAPYSADPNARERVEWTDVYSGCAFKITTRDGAAGPRVVRVKSYREVLAAHRFHPESKSLAADGQPCGRATRGVLSRRAVQLDGLHYIGKESNRLEDVQSGTVHELEDVLTEYRDPNRDPFELYVRPILAEIPKDVLAMAASIHPRKVAAIRNGQAQPRPSHRASLIKSAGSHAKECLRKAGVTPRIDDIAACRLYISSQEDA